MLLLAFLAAAGCGRLGFELTDGGGAAPFDAGGPSDGGGRSDAETDGGFSDGGDAGRSDAGHAADAGSAGDGGPGAAWYSETFDTGIGGWEPTDEQTPAGWRDGASSSWAASFDEWWASGAGTGDRSVAVYRNSTTATIRWRRRFLNDTGRTIVGLRIRYDVEVSWCRQQATDPAAPDHGSLAGAVAWFTVDGRNPVAVGPMVTNDAVGPGDHQRWLTDAEMDALGLSIRGVEEVLTDLDVPPGAELSLRWGQAYIGVSDNEHRLVLGIDNLQIEPIH